MFLAARSRRNLGTISPSHPQAETQLDDELGGVLGDELLSFRDPSDRTLLMLAEFPRSSSADLVRFLSNRLRPRGAAAPPAPELPPPALRLLLSAAGNAKEVKRKPSRTSPMRDTPQ